MSSPYHQLPLSLPGVAAAHFQSLAHFLHTLLREDLLAIQLAQIKLPQCQLLHPPSLINDDLPLVWQEAAVVLTVAWLGVDSRDFRF